MKGIAIVAVVAAFGVSVAAGVVSYVDMQRTNRLAVQVEKLEKEALLVSYFEAHESEERRTRLDLTSRIEILETTISRITMQAVTVPARRTTPAPQTARPVPEGGWWCYFGRECFRSKEKCIADDSTRESECKRAPRAFCGGKRGSPGCFVDIRDCISNVANLGKFVGGSALVFDDDVQQNCVEIE